MGVTIKEVGNNLFLAIFANEEDMVEVLDKSPWSFHKRLFCYSVSMVISAQVRLFSNVLPFGLGFSTFVLKV